MKKLAVEAINIYQKFISLPLKMILGKPRICYQYPTCSQYTKESIERYGFVKGAFKGLTRIINCRPAYI